MSDPIVLSICDHSGAWSAPYIRTGLRVIRVDPKHDSSTDQGGRGLTTGKRNHLSLQTVRMSDGGEGLALTAGELAGILECDPLALGGPIVGLLMAPPCTDFSVSGARWWADKDADGRTLQSVSIVKECLRLVAATSATLKFWVLENPVGRLPRLVPELGKYSLAFHPCDYAGLADQPDTEAYTKRTCLWGSFNANLQTAYVPPVMYEKVNSKGKVLRGSWMWANLGGKSERTKELRSVTPVGFSRAFATANPV